MMCSQQTFAQHCRPQRAPSVVLVRAVAQVSRLDKHTAAIKTSRRRQCDIIRSVRIGGLELSALTSPLTLCKPRIMIRTISPITPCIGGTPMKTGYFRKMLVTQRCVNLVMTISPRYSSSTSRVVRVPIFRFMPMETLHWKCR